MSSGITIKQAMDCLRLTMFVRPNYALTFHDILADTMMEVGVSYEVAHNGASKFMKKMFNANTYMPEQNDT